MGEVYNVIGLMSGTSMDGLDIAYCTFEKENHQWSFNILCAETLSYSNKWLNNLNSARDLNSIQLANLNVEYGYLLGEQVLSFIRQNNISNIDFISSHGHTIHHLPDEGLTVQIGDGQTLSDTTSLPVIYDFRVQDVKLGGQGAPLVPIGDKLLFTNFEACLNLGGFANISFESNQKRVAFDICPVNIVLNFLARRIGLPFDKNGDVARTGELIPELLEELNNLEFYSQNFPKSLGIEWVEKNIYPLLLDEYAIPNVLFTIVSHISIQINKVVMDNKIESVLVTGGGAFNSFLMQSLQSNSPAEFVVPNNSIIDFKEALIFAFLGVLRKRNENNVLYSVTGANQDHSSGKMVFPSHE